MDIRKLNDESLSGVSGGVPGEKFRNYKIVTLGKNDEEIVVTSLDQILPDEHYWLNPNTGVPGSWMVLGYGRDGNVEKYFRALNGEDVLGPEELTMLEGIKE